ncbi:MAG: O-acetyl-ADP-ribose deacetylase [Flavihumibacter sp.]
MAVTIRVVQGDITKMTTDAIVNAANSSLMGGVDGAIHRPGGTAILDDCRKIVARQGGCKTGEAVITTGGRLPAKFVIHTVGPVWQGGHKKEGALLGNCYRNSLRLATDHALTSIAFPNISTGIYGYPKAAAAQVAFESVTTFEDFQSLREIVFVCFDAENFHLLQKLAG